MLQEKENWANTFRYMYFGFLARRLHQNCTSSRTMQAYFPSCVCNFTCVFFFMAPPKQSPKIYSWLGVGTHHSWVKFKVASRAALGRIDTYRKGKRSSLAGHVWLIITCIPPADLLYKQHDRRCSKMTYLHKNLIWAWFFVANANSLSVKVIN